MNNHQFSTEEAGRRQRAETLEQLASVQNHRSPSRINSGIRTNDQAAHGYRGRTTPVLRHVQRDPSADRPPSRPPTQAPSGGSQHCPRDAVLRKYSKALWRCWDTPAGKWIGVAMSAAGLGFGAYGVAKAASPAAPPVLIQAGAPAMGPPLGGRPARALLSKASFGRASQGPPDLNSAQGSGLIGTPTPVANRKLQTGK